MKAFLLIALTTLAIASTANALCVHTIKGHAFNLCPFENPFDINYSVLPYFSANFTFSLAKANVPSCKNSTVNGWFAGINIDGDCATVTTDPIFNMEVQGDGVPQLAILYVLDNRGGNMTVNLICNQTAPHNANVDFFVNGVLDDGLVVSGYSYYGCPVQAADGRKFLQF